MQLSVYIHLSLCDVSSQIRDRMGDICVKQGENEKLADLSIYQFFIIITTQSELLILVMNYIY